MIRNTIKIVERKGKIRESIKNTNNEVDKMNKKVFIISSSPRKGGNSDTMADEFLKGTLEAGNTAVKINIRDMELKFCIGCLSCQRTGKCVLKDGMNELYDTVQHADILVFATPVYYYGMTGQLKTFLDRLNPLFCKDNSFKEVYLLMSAAENEDCAMDGTINGAQCWIDCFDGVAIKDVLCGIGLTGPRDIDKMDFKRLAYEMGKNV